MMSDKHLKVLVVSAEAAPFAKTGGLADVAGSLPKALSVLGNDVRIVMPRYKMIKETEYVTDFPVAMGNRQEGIILRKSKIEAILDNVEREVPVYFIDNYHYFYRDGIYGYYDEAERFTLFCKAVLEMLPRINFQPDVIHCNDWHTGPICLLLKTLYKDNQYYSKIATVYTVHNLLYQGNFGPEVMEYLGVGKEVYHPEGAEFFGNFSFMKAGLAYADVINTVSKTYAKEIQTPEYGEKLEGFIRKRVNDLYGIINGLNYHEFNPWTDPKIYKNYNIDHLENKRENKYALQRELRLPERDVPVIGLVSRLVDHKGLDLITQRFNEIMALDLQLIILGTGEPRYEEMFEKYKARYPEKVGVYIGFNSVLAQRIYAGSDMFLMPSHMEPCGLGQLISLRYGTIPIVRATGGLADTIHDYNSNNDIGNGFSFQDYNSKELLAAIQRAMELYNRTNEWQSLVRRALTIDYSWARSGDEYLKLYEIALEKVSKRVLVA